MNLKKTGMAIAIATFVMSGSALAGYGYGGGGDSTEHNDFLSHNNTNIGAGNDNNGNGAGNDGNTLTSNKGGGDDNNKTWKNSGNTKTKTTTGGGDDNNKTWKNSANTTTTTTTTNTLNKHQLSMEVDMVVAKSDLDGHISNVSVEYGEAGSMYRRGCGKCAGAGVNVRNSNSIDGFASAAGITTIGQNAGAASLVQQSVVTNASVHTK
ncbi:hypothetical protein RJD39_18780 [Vibrio scophthalmi]|uniref:Signal transducer and activator of transcription n=1 Tax=Vibrio scophthalmi TaxID=45658 RepID=A0A1E3WHY8_9VIBR|nr:MULTISPECIES: hypothetical protein [Vibrio]EGU34438.1 hypothetical protein VIBRN418_06606 [Vibrio sp. N418]MCY9802416.1 hypothetical protein [Vibrio scophthalmi]ODS05424.1 Signal transducer and activator of transcription [Vibrio scophthalmi]